VPARPVQRPPESPAPPDPQSPARPVQRRPDPSASPERRSGKHERSSALGVASLELEQELAAIEQETRRLGESPVSAEHQGNSSVQASGLRSSPAAPRIDDTDVEQRRRTPRRLRPQTRGRHRFNTAPLFPDDTELRPEGRWRTLTGAASVIVFIGAIIGGGYLYYRLGMAPGPSALLVPSPERAPGKASIEPRAAHEVSAAPVVADAVRTPEAVAPPVASDADKAPEARPVPRASGEGNVITQIGTGTPVPEPSCPAAVAAMGLCDRLAKASRQ
jgi:hypothetical protein